MLLSLILFGASVSHAVQNGTLIADSSYPAVRRLVINGNATCTGTYIGPRTLLTAAHCVEAAHGGFSARALDIVVDGQRPIDLRAHPRYVAHAIDMQAYDVALLEFASDRIAFSDVAEIAPTEAREGDEVTIVGYGIAENVVGIKREGHNVVAVADMGQHLVSDESCRGSCSTSTGGDSGGPLFDSSGRLLGITGRASVPGLVMNGRPVRMSSYVSIGNPEIREYLRSAASELARSKGRRGD